MSKMREEKLRFERRVMAIKWALIALAVILVALCILGAGEPEVEPTPAGERAAQYAAQEEYYRIVNTYGDSETAQLAARLLYEDMTQ